MELFVLYIIICIFLGFLGSKRNIGFWGAFLLSFFLSPLVGLIFILVSKKTIEFEPNVRHYSPTQTSTQPRITKEKNNQDRKGEIIEQLEKLQRLKNDGILTQQEFMDLKHKIVNPDEQKFGE